VAWQQSCHLLAGGAAPDVDRASEWAEPSPEPHVTSLRLLSHFRVMMRRKEEEEEEEEEEEDETHVMVW
jgi:siroheme synthase (precorrin-2 oxidase/ferrochelatase)